MASSIIDRAQRNKPRVPVPEIDQAFAKAHAASSPGGDELTYRELNDILQAAMADGVSHDEKRAIEAGMFSFLLAPNLFVTRGELRATAEALELYEAASKLLSLGFSQDVEIDLSNAVYTTARFRFREAVGPRGKDILQEAPLSELPKAVQARAAELVPDAERGKEPELHGPLYYRVRSDGFDQGPALYLVVVHHEGEGDRAHGVLEDGQMAFDGQPIFRLTFEGFFPFRESGRESGLTTETFASGGG